MQVDVAAVQVCQEAHAAPVPQTQVPEVVALQVLPAEMLPQKAFVAQALAVSATHALATQAGVAAALQSAFTIQKTHFPLVVLQTAPAELPAQSVLVLHVVKVLEHP